LNLNGKTYRCSSRRRIVTQLHRYRGYRVVGRIHCAREQWLGSFFRWRTLSTVPPLATANWRSVCATRT